MFDQGYREGLRVGFKSVSLIFAVLFASSCDAGEQLVGDTERGFTPPIACLDEWDRRLAKVRDAHNNPELYGPEEVEFDASGGGNLNLAGEFMGANGWWSGARPPSERNKPIERITFYPPFVIDGLFHEQDEPYVDSRYGLLIPCQASWLSGVSIARVIRRYKNGEIAYEVTHNSGQ